MDCRYFQVPLWTLWPSKSVPPQWAGLPLRWAVPYQLRTLGRWATRCSSNHRTAWRALWKPSWLSVPTTSCSTAEPQTPAGGTHPAYMVHINAHDYFQLGPLWSSFKPQTHQNLIQFHIFYTLWDVLNFSVHNYKNWPSFFKYLFFFGCFLMQTKPALRFSSPLIVYYAPLTPTISSLFNFDMILHSYS